MHSPLSIPYSPLPTPHSPPDLSIIIVSWNVWDLLRGCLASIERLSRPGPAEDHTIRHFGSPERPFSLEVMVVDNVSTDVTVDGVRTLFPWVRLIQSETNAGFTGGNNRGYRESRGSFIFFLNPDTELPAPSAPHLPNPLWNLFATSYHEPGIGVVGPQLRYGDGTLQSSRRRFPGRLTGFFESTWLGQAWPQNPWARHLHLADWPATVRQDVDWMVGAALFCRREALEAIRQPGDSGPFDEGFFMYSEETDLCRRVKMAGWRVVYQPDAVVIHYEGRSSEQVLAARSIRFNTSKVRYYRKWFGPVWAELLRRYLLLEFRVQLLLEQIKGGVGHKRALRAARVQVYREVIASQLR
jgi:N-acetylglucosaminyl-diphospho-decaprenol L-rhamnosyltransferase